MATRKSTQLEDDREMQHALIRIESCEERILLLEDESEAVQKTMERIRGGIIAIQCLGAFLTFLFGLAQCVGLD